VRRYGFVFTVLRIQSNREKQSRKTVINALLEKNAVFYFAVKLNCLVNARVCLDHCVNCFESRYITLEKCVKSIEKNCNTVFLDCLNTITKLLN